MVAGRSDRAHTSAPPLVTSPVATPWVRTGRFLTRLGVAEPGFDDPQAASADPTGTRSAPVAAVRRIVRLDVGRSAR